MQPSRHKRQTKDSFHTNCWRTTPPWHIAEDGKRKCLVRLGRWYYVTSSCKISQWTCSVSAELRTQVCHTVPCVTLHGCVPKLRHWNPSSRPVGTICRKPMLLLRCRLSTCLCRMYCNSKLHAMSWRSRVRMQRTDHHRVPYSPVRDRGVKVRPTLMQGRMYIDVRMFYRAASACD